MKQRRARRGKPSSAKRVAARRERANRACAQWRVVEIEMVALVKSSRMTAAIQLCHYQLPQLCERLKLSTERWLQSLWRRLMIQHASRPEQGAFCDRQTVAASNSDQNETQCYLPISFYTNRILWHGRVQDMYRTIQGAPIKNSRQRLRLQRRQEVCFHVATWWSWSMDICPIHLLAYPCVETDIVDTGVARNLALLEAPEQRAAIHHVQTKNGEERATCEPYTCCKGCIIAQS